MCVKNGRVLLLLFIIIKTISPGELISTIQYV